MAATARPRTSPGCKDAAFLMLAVALCTLGPVRTSNPLSPAAAPAADCAGKGKAGSNCSGKLQDRRAGRLGGEWAGGLDGPQALLLPTPSILPPWLLVPVFRALNPSGFFCLKTPISARHATWAPSFLPRSRPWTPPSLPCLIAPSVASPIFVLLVSHTFENHHATFLPAFSPSSPPNPPRHVPVPKSESRCNSEALCSASTCTGS